MSTMVILRIPGGLFGRRVSGTSAGELRMRAISLASADIFKSMRLVGKDVK